MVLWIKMENNKYNEKMLLSCLIWKVEKGKVIEVKVDNEIFVKKSLDKLKEHAIPSAIEPQITEKYEHGAIPGTRLKYELGKRLSTISSAGIYKNVLDDLMDAIKEHQDNDHIKDNILKKYHPNVLPETLSTYLSVYKRYIKSIHPELSNILYPYRYIKDDTTIKTKKDKGRIIARMSHNSLYENILNDYKDACKRGFSRDEIKDMLKTYYPSSQLKSMNTYLSLYRRYLIKKGIIKKTIDGYVYIDDDKEILIKKEKRSYTKRKRRRRKRPGSVGFDKRYNTHVMEEDVQKVKNAINTMELNFVPTSYNIKEKTGLPIHIVRATLHWMADQKMITWAYENGTGPIYRMIG